MDRIIVFGLLFFLLNYFGDTEGFRLGNGLGGLGDSNTSLTLSHELENSLDEEENDELSSGNSSLDNIHQGSEASLVASNDSNASSSSLVDTSKPQLEASSTQVLTKNTFPGESSETTTGTSNKVSKNESHRQSSEADATSKTSPASVKINTSGAKPTNTGAESTGPTNPAEEEKVVLGTRQTIVLLPKTILQKTIEWMGDAYTLSILIPITAGVVFACTIISIIALCSCIRRRCHSRRPRRKALPDSVKNLTPSDRARLLAESTDEEF